MTEQELTQRFVQHQTEHKSASTLTSLIEVVKGQHLPRRLIADAIHHLVSRDDYTGNKQDVLNYLYEVNELGSPHKIPLNRLRDKYII